MIVKKTIPIFFTAISSMQNVNDDWQYGKGFNCAISSSESFLAWELISDKQLFNMLFSIAKVAPILTAPLPSVRYQKAHKKPDDSSRPYALFSFCRTSSLAAFLTATLTDRQVYRIAYLSGIGFLRLIPSKVYHIFRCLSISFQHFSGAGSRGSAPGSIISGAAPRTAPSAPCPAKQGKRARENRPVCAESTIRFQQML